MKRILIAGALALAAGGQALAADLPQPGPPPRGPATYVPVPVPVFTWTGIYIGVNGGYAFGDSNWTSPAGTAFVGPPTFGAPCTTNCSTGNFSTDGFLVGGTIGGNYQWGQFVLGVEGDWDWSNLNGTTYSTGGGCNLAGCASQSDWLATARVRVGYAFDRFLVYGTGGAAFGNLQAAAGTFPFSSSTQTGWTAGGGIEYAFLPNWTAKVEYLYVDLGNQSCGAANCFRASGIGPATTVSLTENVIRAGVNFKFW
jgi:outer membrane immunogenic protein